MKLKQIITASVITVCFHANADWLYMVVDLSDGPTAKNYPISYLPDVPEGGWTDEYKTTKLVLRRIVPGTFTMGCQEQPDYYWDTQGYQKSENIKLTKDYFIGVFEMTQKQFALITGRTPSHFKGDLRPLETISYDELRGTVKGAEWPKGQEVDADSILGMFRQKTGVRFDLPTDAQWEYACRAGTTTDYNNGQNFSDWYVDSAASLVGRCFGNQNDGKGGFSGAHTTVGSYTPNAWGLYDMHGNVYEWVLDWLGEPKSDVVDPLGPESGSKRIMRGGCYHSHAHHVSSWVKAYQLSDYQFWIDASNVGDLGFRVALVVQPDGGPYIEEIDGVEIRFSVENGFSVVQGCNGSPERVRIPVALGGRPVMGIASSAFANQVALKTVVLDEGVQEIGAKAFVGCQILDGLKLPQSVVSLGDNTFSGCGRLNAQMAKAVLNGTITAEVTLMVTNVAVNYIFNSIQPEFALPATSDRGFVNIIAEVKGGVVSVPESWADEYPKFTEKFGSDFTKALAMKTGKKDGAGNDMFVWQDYVAGTDPTKEDDVFTASITIVDGEVKVSYLPELDDARKALRKYTTWGKAKLTDKDWSVVGEGEEGNFNFFKVTVEMR